MIDYQIISTGSKGNAVVINSKILIDCGVPFKALKDAYKGLQLVLLTHCHVDHMNCPTIKKLAQERPTLRWGVPHWLVGDMAKLVEPKNIDVYDMDKHYNYGAYEIIPKSLVHNVPNCGYLIHIGDKRLVYATDTNSMDGIVAKNYDLYMIEANYNEEEITERIRQKQAKGEYCHEWDVLHNHLSEQKALDFIYKNIGSNSEYVFLHQHEEVETKCKNMED